MPVITLTTDLGLSDYYAGSLKGVILSQYPEAVVVDISHNVPAFDIRHGAYVLKHAYPNFPNGTVHIIGINAESSSNQNHIAVYCDEHYFIGADNGIFSLLFDKIPDKIYDLSNIRQETDLLIFPLRDVFIKAACHLARGGTPEVLGVKQDDFLKLPTLQPVFADNMLHGTVIYVDAYGNCVVNITRKLFMDTVKGRKFSILFNDEEITAVSEKYSDNRGGEMLALFNSAGYLELSIYQGKIASMYGTEPGSPVLVKIE